MAGSTEEWLKAIEILTSSNQRPQSFAQRQLNVEEQFIGGLHTSLKALQQYTCKVLSVLDDDDLDSLPPHAMCRRYLDTLLLVLRKLRDATEETMTQYRLELASDPKPRVGEHSAPKLSPDVFSVGQQECVSKAFQFIVALGILPHLEPGVGSPLSVRSKLNTVVASLVKPDPSQLSNCIDIILDVMSAPGIRSVFLSKHLSDLIAALIQISTAGKSHDPSKYRNALDTLISKSYPPAIVKELLTLQSPSGLNAPDWLRATCGHHLTRILTGHHGVKHIIAAMITESEDWRKYSMIGRVIATPPRGWLPAKYLEHVSAQILELVTSENDHVIASQYGRVAAAVMCAAIAKYPDLGRRFLWEPLTRDLCSRCLDKQDVCVQSLSKVMCCFAEPQSELMNLCLQVLPGVFNVYVRHSGHVLVSDTRLCCEELISLCMQFGDSEAVNRFLLEVTFPCTSDCEEIALALQREERVIACITFAVGKVKITKVIEDYFLTLLSKLTSLMQSSPSLQSDLDSSVSSLESLLGRMDPADKHQAFTTVRFRVMSLLMALCDQHSAACLAAPQHVIAFVQSTLSSFISTFSGSVADATTENLSLCLGLLTALMSGAQDVKLQADHWSTLSGLSHQLAAISLMPLDENVRALALNIRVAIATHALVQLHDSSSCARGSVAKDNLAPRPQIESETSAVISVAHRRPSDNTGGGVVPGLSPFSNTARAAGGECSSKVVHESTDQSSAGQYGTNKEISPYRTALVEICDSLIAVKGHAIISLTKLVKSKDAETIQNLDSVINVFREHLAHSDTYIYLSAINGLCAVGDRSPAKVVPILCHEYKSSSLTSETQLKVGEVIVRMTRLLGDLAPAFRDEILSSVLIGSRSRDDLVRASSLTNLGELCKLLGYSLGRYVHEVIECICSSLDSDGCLTVRQAAAHTINLLICGLGRRCFDVLGGDCLIRIYRSIKRCCRSETDEVLLHHCAVALKAMDGEVMVTLFPDKPLEKRLFILDPPDS